ncbi:MAG: 16S rRNA (guanine(527)-N(7))-methyltransferase RsmG [Planctomycetaceae bacterium]|nr:16S rRNA (guanine(527)-N(7))-methyltransferase RsmG [Planctomycetaceae bacterium]
METDLVQPDGSLAESLKKYGIAFSASKVRKLDEYCQLLWDWNTRLNLTRHTDYDKFVSRDIVDCMALSEFLREKERVLDVGTGGGVPGVVLAILRPDLQIELCDSTGKKTTAVSEILRELKIKLPVYHSKAEAVLATRGKGTRFTSLTIRAVSRLPQLLRMAAPYWTIIDRLLLVKGPKWVEERGEARHYNLVNKLALRILKTYPMPPDENGVSVDSVILQVCRKDEVETLDKVIDAHKIEEPEEEYQPRKKYHRKR